jgi:hypothetical protein
VPWTAADLPDLTGTTVLVTGATAGLGEATTIALATRGAHVVLATRDAAKTETLMRSIRDRRPTASLEHLAVDLADLASVACGRQIPGRHDRLDRLVANAGVMATPLRRTVDGFELQLGVNHLGHHALVGRLLPALLAAPAARVVVVSSAAHRMGRIDLDDLNWERTRYQRWRPTAARSSPTCCSSSSSSGGSALRGAPRSPSVRTPATRPRRCRRRGPAMQGGLSGAVTTLAVTGEQRDRRPTGGPGRAAAAVRHRGPGGHGRLLLGARRHRREPGPPGPGHPLRGRDGRHARGGAVPRLGDAHGRPLRARHGV